ncbi:hypothetical protein SEA_C3PO_62 [Corynebacterium phage C3PO]|uniref:Uncharacterized protein n=2 Tax=Corynebacterium virus C3PO TaxID=2560393 RepID=A0A3G3LW21_9CAUD|nr:hypothetical protein FDJ10_gp81 [Corynebacterium phage C3PO]ATW58462.1 hypothetical protein SEA_C3PO_62 [Corynebacterium phage C3PO]AYQ98358.1 hypothetical protein CRUELLA_62 [Corynebacterium phage Cruella]
MIDMNGNPVCETYGDECICTTGADILRPVEYGHQFVVDVNPNCPEHGRHTWPAPLAAADCAEQNLKERK